MNIWLIGLGESVQDRIELAFALRELGVESIPFNVLMPVRGTPLETNKTVSGSELLKTVALFRCINPTAKIRFAGGRPLNVSSNCVIYWYHYVIFYLKSGWDALPVQNTLKP